MTEKIIQKLYKNGCTNIISLIYKGWEFKLLIYNGEFDEGGGKREIIMLK